MILTRKRNGMKSGQLCFVTCRTYAEKTEEQLASDEKDDWTGVVPRLLLGDCVIYVGPDVGNSFYGVFITRVGIKALCLSMVDSG